MERAFRRHIYKLKEETKGKLTLKKAAVYFLIGAFLGVVLPAIILFVIYSLYEPQLPNPRALEEYAPPLVTRVISDDGVLLAEFAGETRIWVPLEEVSPNFINAILAIEDHRFFKHWGVNVWAILRALYVDLRTGRRAQGASTITQQLTRSLFLTREKIITRKIREALTAIKIEHAYSKNEILELLINHQYMGKGCYGVEAAARFFFRKRASEIDLKESATLAGLLQAPSRYVNNLDRMLSRRNTVLKAMRDNGMIDRKTLDSLSREPLGIIADEGIRAWKAPYFVEFIRRYIESKYGDSYLYDRGITIYTTLNWGYQQKAEQYFSARIDTLERWQRKIHKPNDTLYTEMVFDSASGDSVRRWKELQGSMLAIVPSTGEIRVMVGGTNFFESQYNRAVQGGRQAGSAFKPFVFTAAVDNRWTTVDTLLDTPEVYPMENGELWRPQNYDLQYKGVLTLRQTLAQSRNAATVKLCKEIGPRTVVDYAKAMGISTKLEPYLSIAMGTSDVKMIDMVSAYAVFPNLGVRVEPFAVKKIVDRDGSIIEENTPQKKVVLSPATAYVVLSMLQSVVDNGTGYPARLYGFDRPAGGKTGTTDKYTDAWFIGFTPQLCCGVHVGYDDYRTPIGDNMSGARAALPIWTKFMLHAHKGLVVRDFEIPTGQVAFVDVCSESHKLATNQCPKKINEVFIAGKQPSDYCPPGFHTKSSIPNIMGGTRPQQTDERPDIGGSRKEKKRTGGF